MKHFLPRWLSIAGCVSLVSVMIPLTSSLPAGAAVGFTEAFEVPERAVTSAELMVLGADNSLWTVIRGGGLTHGADIDSQHEVPVGLELTDVQGGVSDPDSNIWFIANSGVVWRITPDEVATKFDLRSDPTTYLGLRRIVSGPDGNLWIFATNTQQVFRVAPDGSYAVMTAPDVTWESAAASAPDGRIWYVGSNGLAAFVPGDQVDGSALVVTSYPGVGWSRDMTVGADGNLWVADGGYWRMTRVDMTGTITPCASTSFSPERVVRGSDGNVWASGNYTGAVARIEPDCTTTEFLLYPEPNAQLGAMVSAPNGNVLVARKFGNLGVGEVAPDGTLTHHAFLVGAVGPIGLVAGPDGNLWYTTIGKGEDGRGWIGRMAPDGTGNVLFPLPLEIDPGMMAVGGDGRVWFNGARRATQAVPGSAIIGAIAMDGTISISDITPPSPDRFDEFSFIAAGADGSLWTMMSNQDAWNNNGQPHPSFAVRVTPDGAQSFFPLPENTQAWGVVSSKGRIWIGGNDRSGNVANGRIIEVSPDGTMTAHSLGNPDALAFSLAATPDGDLWFTDPNLGSIGHFSTTDFTVESFTVGPQYGIHSLTGVSPDAIPYLAITVGPDGHVWAPLIPVSENAAFGQVVRLDPSDGSLERFVIPEAAPYAYAVTPGPDGRLWIANFMLNQLVAIDTGVPHAVAPAAGDGQSSNTGTSFGSPMSVEVRDRSGDRVEAGYDVTFEAPSSGASGDFAASGAMSAQSTSVTVKTDANGVATAPAFTANGVAGSYQVTATDGSFGHTTSFTMTNVAVPVTTTTTTTTTSAPAASTTTTSSAPAPTTATPSVSTSVPTGAQPRTGAAPSGALPRTGSNATGMLWSGFGTLICGMALTAGVRRRRGLQELTS